MTVQRVYASIMRATAGWRVSLRKIEAILLLLVLLVGTLGVKPAYAADPIPGYLAEVSLTNLSMIGTALVNDYGPRRHDRNIPFLPNDTQCTNSTTVYPKSNIEMASDYARSLFVAMGYAESSITMEEVPGGYGHNVFVTKTGSLHPSRFIEFSAHLDTQPDPGGGDNASGSAAVFELARVLKDYNNLYSMRFALWVGEEIAVPAIGSNYHVQQALARGETIKAGLNMDATGWAGTTGYWNEIWHNGGESERIADLFNVVRSEYAIDIGFQKNAAWSTSDERGYWYNGQIAVSSVGGISTNMANKHSCGDTAANINFTNVLRAAQQNLAVGLKLDAEPVLPTITLVLQPSTITANGVSTSTATATVKDPEGNSLNNEIVTFSTSGDVSIGGVTNNGNGTYSVTITASTTPGDETITAADGSVIATATLQESAYCPGTCITDTKVTDFNAGTLSGTYVSQTDDGEVLLVPTLGEEFSGPALPGGWTQADYGSGSPHIAEVSNGQLRLDGKTFRSDTLFAPGSVLEFVATFDSGNLYQFVGLDYNIQKWAGFGVDMTGTNFIVTTNAGGGATTTTLTGYLGTPHRYRVERTTTDVTYFIDGIQVAKHTIAITGDMNVLLADYNVGGGANLLVDWVRMSPYASTGTFTSRVLDLGGPIDWGTASWMASTPPGTGAELLVRTGNTPGVWTDFASTTNGASLGVKARYLQYKVNLTTNDTRLTPALEAILFSYIDTIPPTIIGKTPESGAVGVALNTDVTATFNETMMISTITDSSFRLRASGASTDVPATVNYTGMTATLHPITALATGTVYRATVSGSVTDTAGNPLGGDVTWTFTTTNPAIIDTTVNDLTAGTLTGTYVSQMDDGEVLLVPTLGEEFSGPALPGGWTQADYGSGSPHIAEVSNGQLRLDGKTFRSDTLFAPGSVLEFVATFYSGNPYQFVGLDYNIQKWAGFGVNAAGTILQANSSNTTTNLTGYLGSPHRYRVERTATDVTYYVDGIQVAKHTIAITGNMNVFLADYIAGSGGGANLLVDWLRMSPYASSGTFTSRIFDAGEPVAWGDLTSSVLTPAGTSISFETRTGNVATPDGSWSSWQMVNSPIASPNGRYIQYRGSFSSSDPALTPTLESVELTYEGIANFPPVAVNDTYNTDEGVTLSIPAPGVLTNDTDADLDPLTAIKVTDPINGTLVLNSDGSFNYVPANDFIGDATFTYQASDGSADSNIATVTVHVTTVPPPPLPSSFHGGIHFSDSPPDTSNTVDILAPGVSGNAAVAAIILVDPNLVYQVNVHGDLPDTPTKEGGVENDLLTFLVNGRVAAKSQWHAGTSVLLNLHPPEALPGGPYSGNEAYGILFHGSANDWGLDATTYLWDFNNDGIYEESGQVMSWTWMQDGTHTVNLKVVDSQGGEGFASVQVTVNNVPPVAYAGSGPYSGNEGSSIDFAGSAFDIADDPLTYEWDFTYDGITFNVEASGSLTPSHTYDDKGSYTVALRVTDDHDSVIATQPVTVYDVFPTNVNAGGPYTGISGQAIALAGSATCIPTDYCTYAWDLDGNGTYDDATGASPSHTWFATGDSTIRLQVTDNDGNTVTSAPVNVHINLATCIIPLVADWNLVSCNIHPVLTTVPQVLSTIAGKYDLVYAYDPTGIIARTGNWMKYSPGAPSYSNNLPYLDEKMGFWIHATEECTLTISGNAQASTDIPLWDDVGGWNLVGYPSVAVRALPGALSNHGVGGNLMLIFAYHAIDTGNLWKKFDPHGPIYTNNLLSMTPGWGYWIQVSADSTWAINFLAP